MEKGAAGEAASVERGQGRRNIPGNPRRSRALLYSLARSAVACETRPRPAAWSLSVNKERLAGSSVRRAVRRSRPELGRHRRLTDERAKTGRSQNRGGWEALASTV